MKRNAWFKSAAVVLAISCGVTLDAEEDPNQVLTTLSSTTLSGYVDTSAIWNFDAGDNGVPGRSFDGEDKQDGFNLNVVNLTLERPVGETLFGAGYNIDLLFGPDANTYGTLSQQALNANTDGDGYGDFAVKQAYVALRAPVGRGLDFKLGVWDTIIGYEVFDAGENWNYSRSYGYFIEPLAHTGLLATYIINDYVAAAAGIANTVTTTINARSGRGESHKTYMASVALRAPHTYGLLAGSDLYLGVVEGFGGNPGEDQANYYVGVVSPTPLAKLSLGSAFDYRTDGVVAGSDEWAVSLYASYRAFNFLTLNARGEYAQATDTGGAGLGNTGGLTAAGALATPGEALSEVYALTLTADLRLWENVITRGEFRWDHDAKGEAFGGGQRDDALSLAVNVIYLF